MDYQDVWREPLGRELRQCLRDHADELLVAADLGLILVEEITPVLLAQFPQDYLKRNHIKHAIGWGICQIMVERGYERADVKPVPRKRRTLFTSGMTYRLRGNNSAAHS